MRRLKNILVTGGAGFIGCNFIHYLMGESTAGGAAFTDAGFDGRIVNVDCLTYAGNAESLKDIEAKYGVSALGESNARYFFEKVDICDRPQIERIKSSTISIQSFTLLQKAMLTVQFLDQKHL